MLWVDGLWMIVDVQEIESYGLVIYLCCFMVNGWCRLVMVALHSWFATCRCSLNDLSVALSKILHGQEWLLHVSIVQSPSGNLAVCY